MYLGTKTLSPPTNNYVSLDLGPISFAKVNSRLPSVKELGRLVVIPIEPVSRYISPEVGLFTLSHPIPPLKSTLHLSESLERFLEYSDP